MLVVVVVVMVKCVPVYIDLCICIPPWNDNNNNTPYTTYTILPIDRLLNSRGSLLYSVFLLYGYPDNIHLSGISLLESTQYVCIGEVQYQTISPVQYEKPQSFH